MGNLWQDVRYAARMLAKAPAFTAVAILSLALGIGANSAIFGIMDAVLLKLLPVRSPEELVVVGWATARGSGYGFSHPLYEGLRKEGASLVDMAGHGSVALSLSAGGQSERVMGEIVSGNYFSMLGVQPIAGRLFTTDDDRTPGAHPVAVVSHGFWQRRFGGDPGLIGRQIVLNSHLFTVIGVTPPAFSGTEVGMAPEVRVPMMMQRQVEPGWDALFRYDRTWLSVMGRLKPGVSRQQAEAGLDTAYRRALQAAVESFPANSRERLRNAFLEQRLRLVEGSQGRSTLRTMMTQPLEVLAAVVALVLLIACSNLAGLLLVRGAARQREISVRLALGASRGRLVRQLLTESLLLSLAGGVFGLLLAFWMGSVLPRFLPPAPFPLRVDVTPDWRLIAFTFGVSVLTGILCGVLPAWQSTRPDLTSGLKAETAGSTGPARGRLVLRKILVVSQVALSLLLLAGAGLLIRTLRNLEALDPGFARERILMAALDPSMQGYKDPDTMAFYERLLERVAALPGVRSASLARANVLGFGGMRRTMAVEGYQPRPDEDMNMHVNFVAPRYLETMGIRLLAGREFTAQDRAGAPRVAIVNETMARRYWPGQNPVGRRVGTLPGSLPDIEVVGLSRDAKYRSLRQEVPPTVYLSYLQERPGEMSLHVRAATDAGALTSAIRSEVQAMDRNMPIYNVRTMEQQVEASLAQERLMSVVTGFFAALALLLAGIGLYGVVAYSAARRTREIGIRMALGAQKASVVTLVLREGLRLVGIGLLIGLGAAVVATRFLSTLLYGVSPTDPATFAVVALILGAVALLAGWLPARRAARVDPASCLRYE